jgi:mannose/fructose/N-acetylgalactosamine-specific phosphotransferase system component IIC
MADLLLLALLGGLLALDGTSVGQFMVSRPMIAGVLTGWVVGDPVLGLTMGSILEVYFISIFPVGGAEFPEGGPPTLVAVAAASRMPDPAGLALGVALGLVLSRVGSWSIRVQRKINRHLAPDPSRGEMSERKILAGHLAAVGLDLVRGMMLSLVGLLVGVWLAGHAYSHWPLERPGTLTLLAIGGALPAGALVGSLGGWRKRGILFGAGMAGFLLAGWIL